MFLALTAAGINANDAMALGMADYALDISLHENLLENLLACDWQVSPHDVVGNLLASLSDQSLEIFKPLASPIIEHQNLLNELLSDDCLSDSLIKLAALETDDKWLLKAQRSVANGSPVSLVLIKAQLERSAGLSLKEVFQQELEVSVQCTRNDELAEGVRALLIDKDKAPKWQYDKVESVDNEYIDTLLVSPWDKADHPLRYL